MKKEITTEDDLMTVINILNGMGIEFWIDGGWGVDILAGKISREHRDIDIDFDSNYTKELLEILFKYGYITETDWFPARSIVIWIYIRLYLIKTVLQNRLI